MTFASVSGVADSSGVIRVLGNLLYAPGRKCLPQGCLSANALTIGQQHGEVLKYIVHHYDGAHGQAFGPFALDQIVDFCRGLQTRLIDCSTQPLYLTTTLGDSAAHTNASVMLGAYLILCESWSVDSIVDCLGREEAIRKFPCSWGKPSSKEGTWVMTVKCCWEGLHAACRHGWLNSQCLDNDSMSSQYRSMLAIYDACWLVPGEILVSADPVTTADDPNPETCTDVWDVLSVASECGVVDPPSLLPGVPSLTTRLAEDRLYRLDAVTNLKSPRPQASQGDVDEIDTVQSLTPVDDQDNGYHDDAKNQNLGNNEADTPSTECSECASNGSVETVCKDFQRCASVPSQASKKSVPFASFVEECGVKLMIRANYSNEPGMPRPSYNAKKWSQLGIVHKDIRFVDSNGGLPKPSSIASLLLADEDVRDENHGAVLIHCKGGFGRSVVLACCLAIYRYDVPGSALLGWSRICRPGAITNRQQEQFLMSLRGSSDVTSFANRSDGHVGFVDVSTSTKCMPCVVQ